MSEEQKPEQVTQEPIDSANELDSLLSDHFSKKEVQPEVKKEEKVEKQEPKQEEVKNEIDKTVVEKAPEQKPPQKTEKLLDPNNINDPVLGSKKSNEGWKVLKENYSKAHKLLSEKDGEITKVKTAMAEAIAAKEKELENLKKSVEDLSGYRAIVDIQADPEFISKYDAPIEKNINQLKSMLKEMNVKDDLINQVDYSDPKLLSMISKYIADNVNEITASEFRSKAEKVVSSIRERNEALSEFKGKHKEILESKKKESFTKKAEEEGRIAKHIEEISNQKDEQGNPLIPFLKEISATDKNNPGEVAQADKHNKVVGVFKGMINEFLQASTPEDKAKLAIAAAASQWQKAELKAAYGKISNLENELKKISAVTNEAPKPTRSRMPIQNGSTKNGSYELDDALADHFSGVR